MINYIDIVLLSVVGFFTFKGIYKGLISEVLGLAGLFVGLVIATKYMSNAAQFLDRYIDVPPALSSLLGYLLVFVGIQLLVQVAIHVFENALDIPFVGSLIRLLGGAVGAAKGLLIVSLLVLLISILPSGESLVPGIRESRTWPVAKKVAPSVFNFVSSLISGKSFYSELKESFDSLPTKQIDQHSEAFLQSLADEVPLPPNTSR